MLSRRDRFLLLGAVLVPGSLASAQRVADAAAGVAHGPPGGAPAVWQGGVPPVRGIARGGGLPVLDSGARGRRSAWAPVVSALLPGGGQAMLGQDRFVAYLAIEGYVWSRYMADLAEGKRQRRRYRQLASDVARAMVSDAKPTGDFAYYERMKHYLESGAYDEVPGGSLEPETDTLTYNGSVWLLARRTYWTDPATPPDPGSLEYQQAVAFYADRAVTAEYRWSWVGAELEQDIFGRTIDRSNSAFRRSIEDLGVILANHALSTVDAYVTVRVRARREPDGSLELEATVPWAPFGRDQPGRTIPPGRGPE